MAASESLAVAVTAIATPKSASLTMAGVSVAPQTLLSLP